MFLFTWADGDGERGVQLGKEIGSRRNPPRRDGGPDERRPEARPDQVHEPNHRSRHHLIGGFAGEKLLHCGYADAL